MAFSISEPNTVYAFDIDGVLTNEEGMRLYNQVKEDGDTAVGIVTTRSKGDMQSFIENNGLDPDFADAVDIKFHTLSVIRGSRDADKFVYVGSYIRDRIAARLARWDYRQI